METGKFNYLIYLWRCLYSIYFKKKHIMFLMFLSVFKCNKALH